MGSDDVRCLKVSKYLAKCTICGGSTNMYYLYNPHVDSEPVRDYIPLCFHCMKGIWESVDSEYSVVKFEDE